MLRGWKNRTLGKWELPAAYLPVRKLIQGKSRQSKLIQGKLKIIPHLIFRIPNTWSGKILKVNPLYCRSPEAKMNSVSLTWWSTVLHLSSQINQVWIFFLIWIAKNQRTNFRRSRFSRIFGVTHFNAVRWNGSDCFFLRRVCDWTQFFEVAR